LHWRYLAPRRVVIHCDIKLGNLLYSNEGVIKVCDFGLSRFGPAVGAEGEEAHGYAHQPINQSTDRLFYQSHCEWSLTWGYIQSHVEPYVPLKGAPYSLIIVYSLICIHIHAHTRALGHFRCLDIHAAHLHEPRSMDSWRTLDSSRFVRVRSLLVGARYRTRSHGWLLIHRRDQKGRTYRRYHQQRSARSLTRTACSPRSLVRR